ncbi:MAG: hypothetical protein OZ922_04180 [Myxococcales bacterium]|nr:hypothetical protein [Myxococcales bacterium]
MTARLRIAVLGILCALWVSSATASPFDGPTPTPTSARPSATIAGSSTAIVTPSPQGPSPGPTLAIPAHVSDAAPEAAIAPPGSLIEAPPATAEHALPRAFRTPERAAPPAFVAPRSGAATDAPSDGSDAPATAAGTAPRSGSVVVVFRVSARTAVEGFTLRIGYPRAAGTFAGAANEPECSAGTGALIAANDPGSGEMKLLVASAQALPLPLDVACRFATRPGAAVGAADFAVAVAEVSSGAKRAEPSLLLVSVIVR